MANKANNRKKTTVRKTTVRKTQPQQQQPRDWTPFWIGTVLVALFLLFILGWRGNWGVNVTIPQQNPQPAATPVDPPSGKGGSDPVDLSGHQGTEACQDGKIISNQFADITRIPIGTAEGAVVAEISWTGSGFGGFDRAVVVVPRMNAQTMAFVLNSKTIHLVQYCGTMQAVLDWAPTHVDALVQSSQDNNGKRPDPAEIGVYFLNLDGSWTVVREGSKGPGLDFVKQHVVMTPQ